MNIEYLFYFADIAKTHSITKSAVNCNLSQQGMSRVVKQLESHYNVKLIKKQGNKTELTGAGEELVTYIELIRGIYEQAELKIRTRGFDLVPTANVTIYLTSLATKALANIYEPLADRWRGLKALDCTYEEMFSALEQDSGLDSTLFLAAIVRGGKTDKKIRDLGLKFTICLTTEPTIFIPKESPLSSKLSISRAELRKFPIIFVDNEPTREVMCAVLGCGDEHLKDYSPIHTSSVVLAKVAAQQGQGVKLNVIGTDEIEGCDRLPLKQPVKVDIGFVHRPDIPIEGAAKNIMEDIRRLIQEMRVQ